MWAVAKREAGRTEPDWLGNSPSPTGVCHTRSQPLWKADTQPARPPACLPPTHTGHKQTIPEAITACVRRTALLQGAGGAREQAETDGGALVEAPLLPLALAQLPELSTSLATQLSEPPRTYPPAPRPSAGAILSSACV